MHLMDRNESCSILGVYPIGRSPRSEEQHQQHWSNLPAPPQLMTRDEDPHVNGYVIDELE